MNIFEFDLYLKKYYIFFLFFYDIVIDKLINLFKFFINIINIFLFRKIVFERFLIYFLKDFIFNFLMKGIKLFCCRLFLYKFVNKKLKLEY